MKKLILATAVILLFCSVEPVPSEPFPYRPIVMKREALESSVAMLEPAKLARPGKIYIKDNYIFINEKYRGIHIVNNTDPSNPVKEGFLRIPGCIDIAMKDNILYADNAVDLVAVDLSDLNNINVTNRIKAVFPEHIPPGYVEIPWNYRPENRLENTIIVEWEEN
ncbi:MAG: hypothetical protein JW723_04335 [Bacteroidales bacterium]|nr:hypothetical protein [Bacteroidales bacterium]